MCISIIIPVYNGAQTLNRCLRSILAQDFEDYQVIIVDDGSIDDTLALAQEWAARDQRFQVVSQHCYGPGKARNVGLTLARGEYVVYMDADDYWPRQDLLRNLAERIEKDVADVYMYQMVKVTEDGTVLERYTKPPFANADRVLSLDEVYEDLVRDGHTLAAVWNKCVRRKLMLKKDIRFREDVLGEDIDWVLQLFSHVRTICLLNIRAYAYTQHRTVSRSTRSEAPNDLATIVDDWARRLGKGDIAHTKAAAGVVAFEYGICMGNHHRLSWENKKRMRRNAYLLDWGLDGKTLLIRRFYKILGYDLTCVAVRMYLLMRRIW